MSGSKHYKIAPSSVGTLIKISRELLEIDDGEILKKENLVSFSYQAITQHAERMARIVAYGIVNAKADPPESMVRTIRDNMTAADLNNIVGLLIAQMDVVNFLKSILTAKGMNLLSVRNPAEQRGQIASGELSAA